MAHLRESSMRRRSGGVSPEAFEQARARVERFRALFAQVAHPLAPGASILDFGCGKGALVYALCAAGFDARGCDFSAELGDGDRLREILDPYRLPFDDACFDCVVSDEVFEHVQDYPAALWEIRRVLRAGGVSLHLFPGPYTPIEPHIFVPLASIIHSEWWLALWARLGIRNQYQRGKPAPEVVRLNAAFLAANTTYYTRRRVVAEARAVFPRARLLELDALASNPHRVAPLLEAIARRVPAVASAFTEVRGRVLFLE